VSKELVRFWWYLVDVRNLQKCLILEGQEQKKFQPLPY
jgi:hypothetical protein